MSKYWISSKIEKLVNFTLGKKINIISKAFSKKMTKVFG
jgi:hypothetical protein